MKPLVPGQNRILRPVGGALWARPTLGILLFALSSAALHAQTIEVYSEFIRVNPAGEVLPVDVTLNPREILSPAVVRGGYASFQVVVRGAGSNYFLFAAANPPEALTPTIYAEEFVRQGASWIPDRLRPTKTPEFGVIPDPSAGIDGQAARVYLLDVWVPPDAQPGRVRLEVQLKAGFWIIYPMELRILSARVPTHGVSSRRLPAINEPSSESAMAPVTEFLDGATAKPQTAAPRAPASLREVIRRNASQDLALAKPTSAAAIREKFAARGGNAEWFLAIRDLIYRSAGTE